MSLYAIMARQLARPHGVIGRLLTGRILERGNRSLNAWTAAQLPIRPGERVLDLGCGPGSAARRIALETPAGAVVGADYALLMARRAAAANRDLIGQGRALFAQGDAGALGFRAGAFDHAMAVNVIYFWPDPAAALRELRRVLRPGGRLALGFRPRALVERLRFQDYGYRPFDGEELRDLAAACGFADLRLLPEPGPPSMPGVCLAGVRE